MHARLLRLLVTQYASWHARQTVRTSNTLPQEPTNSMQRLGPSESGPRVCLQLIVAWH